MCILVDNFVIFSVYGFFFLLLVIFFVVVCFLDFEEEFDILIILSLIFFVDGVVKLFCLWLWLFLLVLGIWCLLSFFWGFLIGLLVREGSKEFVFGLVIWKGVWWWFFVLLFVFVVKLLFCDDWVENFVVSCGVGSLLEVYINVWLFVDLILLKFLLLEVIL